MSQQAVFLISAAGFPVVWLLAARAYRQRGIGRWLTHLAGFAAALFYAVLFTISFAPDPVSPTDVKPTGLAIVIPDTLDAKSKQTLQVAWPKIKAACPGLDRHADALTLNGIEDAYHLNIVFGVTEARSSIPAHYMAAGHNCFFEIAHDGSFANIAKEGCKALCLDRAIEQNDPLFRHDLRIELDITPSLN